MKPQDGGPWDAGYAAMPGYAAAPLPPPPPQYGFAPPPNAPLPPPGLLPAGGGAVAGPQGYAYAYAGGGADARAPLLTPAPAAGGGGYYAAPRGGGGGGGGGHLSSPPGGGYAPTPFGGGAPAGFGGAPGAPYGGQDDAPFGYDLMYASRAMRHGFVRKVLGIVAAQLLLTAAIAAPVFLLNGPRAWLGANRWAVPLAGIVTFATLLCLVCSERARRSYPSNLLLLGAFTAAQGLLVGVACGAYATPTVVLAVVMSAAVCLGLVTYAFQTRYDFTASGGMLYSAVWVLLLVMLFNSVLRLPAVDCIIAGCGALVFCCYLVYDLQLLISGEHSMALSVDEPIVAALNIYVDIINVFLFILQLLGRDDD